MYRTVWLAGLLCLGLSAPVGAQTPNNGRSDSPVLARLIEQLGDADYRKRDEATLKLRAEGVKALPALREAISNSDSEIRRRARDLVPLIETTALLTPKPVTLKLRNRPLREVLDSIERQTGYKVESWGAGNRGSYTFDFNDLPFWQALDTVCQGTGMVVQQGYGDDHIRLNPQDARVPFVRYEGPFRLVPTGFQHYRNIEFGLVGKGGNAARNETLTLNFTVFAEPKVPLLGIGEVHLDAAYDSEKNSMLAPNPNDDQDVDVRDAFARGRWTSRYNAGNRTTCIQASLGLHRPSEKATGVKLIRGRIPVTLLAEQTPVVVAANILKAKGSSTKVDTTSMRIDEVTPSLNKNVQIKMTVSEASDNPNDYSWMNTLYQRIELQDDKGNKFGLVGNGWGNDSPGTIQLMATFAPQNPKCGPPAKLVYYRWVTIQHDITFEFKDLPLP